MIYVFIGDDAKSKHSAYIKFMKSQPKGMETFLISRNDFNKTQVESLYSGSGLFFTKCNVVFSGVLEREELRDFVLSKLPEMAESENNFIFLDSKQSKTITDNFKKTRAEINNFELPKEKAEKFNSFILANALQNKDRLGLWVNYRLAVDNGVALEELSGILFWKAKDMILKKNFSKFTEEELQNFTSRLSYLLPEARRSGNDAETVFEQFLLEVF